MEESGDVIAVFTIKDRLRKEGILMMEKMNVLNRPSLVLLSGSLVILY